MIRAQKEGKRNKIFTQNLFTIIYYYNPKSTSGILLLYISCYCYILFTQKGSMDIEKFPALQLCLSRNSKTLVFVRFQRDSMISGQNHIYNFSTFTELYIYHRLQYLNTFPHLRNS